MKTMTTITIIKMISHRERPDVDSAGVVEGVVVVGIVVMPVGAVVVGVITTVVAGVVFAVRVAVTEAKFLAYYYPLLSRTPRYCLLSSRLKKSAKYLR